MITRQMYGRAGFELLRARVLPFHGFAAIRRTAGTMSCTKKAEEAILAGVDIRLDHPINASPPNHALAALSQVPANTPVSLGITAVGTTFPGANLSVFIYS